MSISSIEGEPYKADGNLEPMDSSKLKLVAQKAMGAEVEVTRTDEVTLRAVCSSGDTLLDEVDGVVEGSIVFASDSGSNAHGAIKYDIKAIHDLTPLTEAA